MDGAAASAAAGLPWFEMGSLTYSFALDGTEFGSVHSKLFAELRGTGSQTEWQATFHSAFMEWLQPLEQSIQLVPDSGMPFGTLGTTQHDQRVGDIRIAAIPLSMNVMAESIPHNMLTQGSWAGDILLNSNADWTDLHQVFSVAMHEFGHVLGLGHSDDPESPMFFHGVFSAMHPTAGDIVNLKKIYAGVHVDSEEGSAGSHTINEWEDEPEFQFDASQAFPLTANVSTTAQYTTSGVLTVEQPTSLYELQPIGEIDHVQYLNIAVIADLQNGLMPQVTVYDSAGDKMSSTILSNGSGVLTLQVKDAEPQHTHYLAVTAAAAPADYQLGSYHLFATFSTSALATKQIGTFNLAKDWPIVEQSFDVSTSRLIHLLAQSTTALRDRQTAIWASVVDSDDHVVAQLAMPVSTSRSAPLFFVPPGHYRLILEAANKNGSPINAITVNVFMDEVSIDVGPGVIDPTLNPNLDCTTPGNNPATCQQSPPIELVDPPVYPDPNQLPSSPVYPYVGPWEDPSWHYWPEIISIFPQHNSLMPLDASGDSLTTPIDALSIINAINSISPASYLVSAGFVDTNNDQLLTPLDALLVINYLNQLGPSSGEGERVVPSTPSPTIQGVDLSWLDVIAMEKLRRRA